MHQLKLGALAALVVGGAALMASPASSQVGKSTYDINPNGKGGGTAILQPKGYLGGNIKYHGGPVILGTTNVYYVWYGNWSGNTATSILTDLAGSIGGSPYFAINTTYGSTPPPTRISNSVHFGGSYNDNYSQGSNLSDTGVFNVVSNAINGGHLPKDTNGVYFVLTSSDVNETSGFCSSYCGWHTYGTIGGSAIKYSFVGNPDRCPTSCEWQTTKSPNNNPGADGMASIIAHELEEAVTDPQLNAWFDNIGQENADKCAWTFGATYNPGNGSQANMKLGSRDYLIQQNWSRPQGKAQGCALSYP